MKAKLLLFVAIVFCSHYPFAQKRYKKCIKLEKNCAFQNRKVTDSFKNQVAYLSFQNDIYILTFKDQKYIVCNLPAGLTSKTLKVSGKVLEILPTERLMGTPLRLTKACSR